MEEISGKGRGENLRGKTVQTPIRLPRILQRVTETMKTPKVEGER